MRGAHPLATRPGGGFEFGALGESATWIDAGSARRRERAQKRGARSGSPSYALVTEADPAERNDGDPARADFAWRGTLAMRGRI
jgi:hypothetical protein